MVNWTEDSYGTFCAGIDQSSVQKFVSAIGIATQNGVKRFHILFQTTGGGVGDGIYLHNFLKSCPIDITLYNAGSVQSIGVIAYLGAKHRKVSATGMFMLHRTTWGGTNLTAGQLTEAAAITKTEDSRTRLILEKNMTLSPEQWDDLRDNQFWFTAQDAVKSKIADAIADFSPPKGTTLFVLHL